MSGMIPRIDPDVKYVGPSKLRELNTDALRALTGAIVVQGANLEPLAVILPYETYLKMQKAIGLVDDGFDERRQEIRDSIERGARQMPRTLREKGDGKR